MLFEWDEEKSRTCLESRGFDFSFASLVFDDEARVTLPDQRFDYGEDRYITYGQISGRLFCVVFTIRFNAIRIISARKANEREVRIYGHSHL